MLKAIEVHAAVVPQAEQRRRHDRGDLCFTVRFQILDDDEALEELQRLVLPGQGPPLPSDERAAEGYTLNISSGGLGLCGDLELLRRHPLQPGDFLKLSIHPDRSSLALRCMATVVWVEPDRDSNLFRAGVVFVAVQQEDLRRLQTGS